MEQKESCGVGAIGQFRAHALALSNIYFCSLGPRIFMEWKPKERKAELQLRSRLGVLGVCVTFYTRFFANSGPGHACNHGPPGEQRLTF